MEILKLAIVFVIMIGLIKFRLKVGLAILAGAICLGAISGLGVRGLLVSLYHTITAWGTIRLLLVVGIISSLGAILKNLKLTDRMVTGVENLSGSIKTTIVLCPAIIGLMPMPGGALLSAPLVGSASEGQTIPPYKLAAINYWFRHIFEFFWPVYPGLILMAAILDVKLKTVSMYQFPFSVMFVLGGLIFLIWPLKGVSKFTRQNSIKSSWMDVIQGVWPIVLVVIITFIFGIDILVSLVITMTIFLAIVRPSVRILLRSVREGCSISILSLIFGVMVFQHVINDSGSAVSLAHQIASWGVPAWVVISLSTFIIGMVSGIVVAHVGIVYPILINLLVMPEPNFMHIMLANASGLMGVMMSPLHLCLILTVEYFKASFSKVYLLILGPALFVGIGVTIFLMLGYGS